MGTRAARRAAADIRAVCRTARPAAAARWLGSLLTQLPECARHRSLTPADRAWSAAGASFRTSTGAVVSLPAGYTAGAREMYCRNVYLRTGLSIPAGGWVVDLGANRGLFAVWAALSGARVVAVDAQHGFAAEITALAAHNGVAGQVRVLIAVAGGAAVPGSAAGVVADDRRWARASHGTAGRPEGVTMPQLMAGYGIGRIGLLKMDIEGGEFAVLAARERLDWLARVDQLALEVHRDFGDAPALISRLAAHGFAADLRDNDGRQVTAGSARLDYAYCRRP